jgi:hypothetical protein
METVGQLSKYDYKGNRKKPKIYPNSKVSD